MSLPSKNSVFLANKPNICGATSPNASQLKPCRTVYALPRIAVPVADFCPFGAAISHHPNVRWTGNPDAILTPIYHDWKVLQPLSISTFHLICFSEITLRLIRMIFSSILFIMRNVFLSFVALFSVTSLNTSSI